MASRSDGSKRLFRRLAELAVAVRHRLPDERSDDALPLIAAIPLALAERERLRRIVGWLLAGAREPLRRLLAEVLTAAGITSDASQTPLRSVEVAEISRLASPEIVADPHYFEQLLRACDSDKRRRRGVFFTPPALARFLVRESDRLLRDEFGYADGLADHSQVRILDPAVGGGVFLLTAVEQIHARLTAIWSTRSLSRAEQDEAWNQYVPRLLPRLAGIDIQPAACLLAHLQLALKLQQLGYRFETPGEIRIVVGDALYGPGESPAGKLLAEPFNVLLGNPPFSGVSENKHPWIERLIDGDARAGVRGYFEVDGQPLGERKHWLKDDYVKFLRLAQWRVEESGAGIVGFITNHGYLDNVTFRGMRQQLATAFQRIAILDLHGNRKKQETPPAGGKDENVFGIDQGVAIGLFRKLPSCTPGSLESGEQTAPTLESGRQRAKQNGSHQIVNFSECWGTRNEKLRQLLEGAISTAIQLIPPHYRFVPNTSPERPEYQAAPGLTELVPISVTAPVTARDAFVVAFTREELSARLEAFRDLSIPDDEIRRRYFTSTRSNKYQAGDTRGWKLAEVRRALAADDRWQDCLRQCLYRPFDWRWIAWDERLIDWPRTELTNRLLDKDSLALITRRQQLPGRPCTFFWVSDGLALDGIIRSDNKGSESLFVVEEPNRDLAAYAYALFNCPFYRDRYADQLRHDFPRVLLPRDRCEMGPLIKLGRKLIDLHCLRDVDPLPGVAERLAGRTIPARYPRYEAGAIWVSPDESLPSIPEPVWSFLVGAHQPCKKWLADRRGRTLTADDATHYARLLSAAAQTLALRDSLDFNAKILHDAANTWA
jgi:hypothetical protein